MGIVGNSKKSSAYYTLDLLVYGLEFIATPCWSATSSLLHLTP